MYVVVSTTRGLCWAAVVVAGRLEAQQTRWCLPSMRHCEVQAGTSLGKAS
jgi:hypothetical protein